LSDKYEKEKREENRKENKADEKRGQKRREENKTILVKKFFRVFSRVVWFCFRRYRAETALRRATTGINTELGRPPDPHQLNNPEDEDRDGLRNVGVYESRTTLPG
jgi:arginine utilization protein RocB